MELYENKLSQFIKQTKNTLYHYWFIFYGPVFWFLIFIFMHWEFDSKETIDLEECLDTPLAPWETAVELPTAKENACSLIHSPPSHVEQDEPKKSLPVKRSLKSLKDQIILSWKQKRIESHMSIRLQKRQNSTASLPVKKNKMFLLRRFSDQDVQIDRKKSFNKTEAIQKLKSFSLKLKRA